MTKPAILQKGDLIAIVATARKITMTELEPAINLLESWGLKYVIGKSIGAVEHQFAGSDVLRAKDFEEQLDNPKVKAIWCARGGYGTARMVDLIDFKNFRKNPKWVVGYSDVTVLHSHINAFSIATIHAQMCLEIEKRTKESRETLRDLLFGNFNQIIINNNFKHNRQGAVKGRLLGGNLSVLCSILGSVSEVELKGAILFIEDLDEMLYHIDRMMQTLKRAGYLKNIAGLVVGGMTDMRDNTIPFGKTAIEIIAAAVEEYDFPVCFNFLAGHIEDNRALILGTTITLKVESTRTIINYN